MSLAVLSVIIAVVLKEGKIKGLILIICCFLSFYNKFQVQVPIKKHLRCMTSQWLCRVLYFQALFRWGRMSLWLEASFAKPSSAEFSHFSSTDQMQKRPEWKPGLLGLVATGWFRLFRLFIEIPAVLPVTWRRAEINLTCKV